MGNGARLPPRIVAVDPARGLFAGVSRVSFKRRRQFEVRSIPTGRSWNSTEHSTATGDGSGKCRRMYDWQLSSFPNCNNLHELDVARMRVINSGKSRIALEMTETIDGEEAQHVYKTMKYRKTINGVALKQQRIDGLIMERTRSSHFI